VSDGKKEKQSRKQKFSDSWIAKHRLDLPQEDWFDTVRPELVLRMSYGGAKTFRVRCRIDGKARTIKLGRWDSAKFNVDAARKAAQKFDPDQHVKPKPGAAGMTDGQAWWLNATFEDVIKKYIVEVVANLRTKKEVERCLNRYVVPALGRKIFIDLKKSDAGQLRRTMRRANGVRQADIVFALIRSVMMWVEDEDILDNYESPVRYRPKSRGKDKRRRGGRERVLDDAELKLVWQAATEMGGLYGGLIRLLLLTAQRRQCLATAQWSEIIDSIWYIREEPGEAKGTGQILQLPPLACQILETLPRIKGNPYVFGVDHKGEHKPFNSFSQHKDELVALLPHPIPRWTLHDLRRTARTRMEDIGIDMQTGEVVLGHALPGVKRTYIRSNFKDKRADALLRLSQHIAGVVGLPPDRGTSSPKVASNIVRLDKARRA
jgi:integrase